MPRCLQRLRERVASRVAHDVEVADRARVGLLAQRHDARALELAVVEGGERPAPFGPGREVAQAHAQQRGLQLVEAAVASPRSRGGSGRAGRRCGAGAGAPRWPGRSPGSPRRRRARRGSWSGRRRARPMPCSPGERAHGRPAVAGAVRLARVLDQHQPPLARELEQRVHVGRVAVEVDRQERLRARGERARDRRGVEVERAAGRRRRRPAAPRRAGSASADEGGRDRGGDHLVARPDARARAARGGARRCRCRPRRRRGAPSACASSRSNASPSGPSTNQPESSTRAIAASSSRAARGHVGPEVDEGDATRAHR